MLSAKSVSFNLLIDKNHKTIPPNFLLLIYLLSKSVFSETDGFLLQKYTQYQYIQYNMCFLSDRIQAGVTHDTITDSRISDYLP